jgi:hypothetical protein
MFPFTERQLILIIIAAVFTLGVIFLAIGIYVLFHRTMGEEVKVISKQIARLAQKGIAEDVAGLVGNASSLMEALNELIRTASGVGVFLILIGLILVFGSAYLLMQLS